MQSVGVKRRLAPLSANNLQGVPANLTKMDMNAGHARMYRFLPFACGPAVSERCSRRPPSIEDSAGGVQRHGRTHRRTKVLAEADVVSPAARVCRVTPPARLSDCRGRRKSLTAPDRRFKTSPRCRDAERGGGFVTHSDAEKQLGRADPSAAARAELSGTCDVQPVFDRPILNSPYARPGRHWELHEHGQPTQRTIESRRRAEFITPIPKPRTRKAAAKQSELVFNEGKGFPAPNSSTTRPP